jgi:hypothetical protein
MSACGRDVPSRDIALAPATELNRWVSAIEISAEVRSWLERRMREISRGGTASCAIAKAIFGVEAPKELAFVNLFDIAA